MRKKTTAAPRKAAVRPMPKKSAKKAVVAKKVIKKTVAKPVAKKVVIKKAPAPAPAPAPARRKKTQAAPAQPQPVFTIKKTHQNKTSYFIDTLENLTARLKYFIMDPIPTKSGRGRKSEKPELVKEKKFKTPQALVEALNDTLVRSCSFDVHYEVVNK